MTSCPFLCLPISVVKGFGLPSLGKVCTVICCFDIGIVEHLIDHLHIAWVRDGASGDGR